MNDLYGVGTCRVSELLSTLRNTLITEIALRLESSECMEKILGQTDLVSGRFSVKSSVNQVLTVKHFFLKLFSFLLRGFNVENID